MSKNLRPISRHRKLLIAAAATTLVVTGCGSDPEPTATVGGATSQESTPQESTAQGAMTEAMTENATPGDAASEEADSESSNKNSSSATATSSSSSAESDTEGAPAFPDWLPDPGLKLTDFYVSDSSSKIRFEYAGPITLLSTYNEQLKAAGWKCKDLDGPDDDFTECLLAGQPSVGLLWNDEDGFVIDYDADQIWNG